MDGTRPLSEKMLPQNEKTSEHEIPSRPMVVGVISYNDVGFGNVRTNDHGSRTSVPLIVLPLTYNLYAKNSVISSDELWNDKPFQNLINAIKAVNSRSSILHLRSAEN